MADAPAMVSTDRADRVADALEEREADVLLVTDLDQRPLADGLHRQQRGRGGRPRGQPALRHRLPLSDAVGRARSIPPGSARSPSTCWPGWSRACPAPGTLRAGLRRRPHERQGPRAAGRHAARRDRAGAGGRRDRGAARGQGRRRARGDPRRRAAGRRRADRGPRARARGPHRARGRARPRVHDAPHGGAGRVLPADRGRRRARGAPARHAARGGDPGGHAGRRRLGRAARRLRLGLHAHVLDGRHRPARRRGLRAGAPRPGGRAGGRAPGPQRARGRRRRALDHRRRRPRRALRPRAGPRGRARRARGAAAVQAGGDRAGRRAWWSPSSPGSTSPAPSACASRTS